MDERQNTIVGVLGTQNVGKTTFVDDVVANGGGWSLFGRNYRDVIASQHLKINRDGDERSQKVIHGMLVQNVADAIAEGNRRLLIMDRTPVDSFVYTKYLAKRGRVSEATLKEMESQMMTCAGFFDWLVYIPLCMCDDVKVVDDRFRDTDLDYRREIDGLMMDALHEIFSCRKCDGNPRMMIVYGTREERVRRFSEKVRVA